jgi:hypothetical protein
MRRVFLVLALLGLVGGSAAAAQAPTKTAPLQLNVIVQGDTSRLPDFVQSMREAFAERGMKVNLVERGAEYDYNILLAQESSLSGAAASVTVLDRNCTFVASVVRSERWSGKGAFNASAKELAKKIAILKGVTSPSGSSG